MSYDARLVREVKAHRSRVASLSPQRRGARVDLASSRTLQGESEATEGLHDSVDICYEGSPSDQKLD